MSERGMARRVPPYAARFLLQGEEASFLTRPRLLPLNMHLFIAAVVLAVVAFSAMIRDPGFMRLLSIPALPVIGGIIGYLIFSPVILVTDRRVMSARRFSEPLSLDLKKLEAVRIRQNRLERLLGYGTLFLLFPHPETPGKGVFLSYEMGKLPDAASLCSAISSAARSIRDKAGEEFQGGPEP